MKVTSIELVPEYNLAESAIFSFRDPDASNPYVVKGITGLDAESIIAKYYGTPTGIFHDLSLENREVFFKIGLNPNYSLLNTYSSLRDTLYKLIASSRTGRLFIKFKNGSTVVAETSGFISKLETALFEKTQDVILSVKCSDPMLKDPNQTTVTVAGLDPANTVIIDNKSTAPHGFWFNLNITNTLASIVINDPANVDWSFSIVLPGGFVSGDLIVFSSVYNQKTLYLVRAGSAYSLADSILPGSAWPIIFPGSNTFSIANPTKVSWASIWYWATYWGV